MMALELYNSTRRIKEVPKFNYTGKLVLKPTEVYGIEDYMYTFYKPYERIGVIIRNSPKQEEVQIEKEVEEVINASVEQDQKEQVEEPKELGVEDRFEGGLETEQPKSEQVEQVEEVQKDVETVEVREETVSNGKYTKKQLNDMKMEELKEIIDKLGIKAPKYKKDAYVKAILDAQG